MPKKPIDYNNTIIYKIVCNNLDIKDVYVGHTTDFTKRKHQHKNICNNVNSKSHNFKVYNSIRENGGWDNWSMIEIEKFECQDKNEATARERYWFETLKANLNGCFPTRSRKEYKEMHSDKIKLESKDYYKRNKEKILMKQSELYLCECGSEITRHKKANHFRSLKHITYCAKAKSKPQIIPDDDESI